MTDTRNQRSTWLWRALIVVAASLPLWLVGAILPTDTPAQTTPQGYTLLGCRYQPDAISPITYRLMTSSPLIRTAFIQGANAWNRVDVPGYFAHAGPNDYNPEIAVYTTKRFTHYIAQTRGFCTGGYWVENEVTIEFNLFYRYNLSQWTLTAEHEQGHAYGLGHSDVCSIMVLGADNVFQWCPDAGYPVTGPSTHEINGVRAIYPEFYG